MADLAAGAVGKLLGLIHNEAQLLGRVQGDVQFIKEEMESIHSFLARQSRMGPGSSAQSDDEQLRTWMKQVGDLAHDCSNCIDAYLRRGDMSFHRSKGGFRRHVWWASWLAHRVVARRSAGVELSKLKKRARDVSERRLRYDVKASGGGPGGPSAAPSSSAQAAATEDDDDDDDDQNQAALPDRFRSLFLEEHCVEKLVGWLKQPAATADGLLPSITFVAPDKEDSGAIAKEILKLVTVGLKDKPIVKYINLPELHGSWDLPLLRKEILCYILQECETQAAGDRADAEETHITRKKAYSYRKDVLGQMNEVIREEIDVDDKIEEIKSKIGVGQAQVGSKRSKYPADKLMLGMIFEALKLTRIGQDVPVPASWEEMMDEAAKLLEAHMNHSAPSVCLKITQYKDTLHKVFLDSNNAQEVSNAIAPTSGEEDHIKEIIHKQKVILDAMQELLQGNSGEEQAEGILGGDSDTAVVKEAAKKKMDEISLEIKNQLVITGVVDKINKYTTDKKILFVLRDDGDYIPPWEETRKALSLIKCATGSALIVTTKKGHRAKEFCCPTGEPITYSLVGLYHDRILQLTRGKRKQDGGFDSQILTDILESCNPQTFAMKIFMLDLYTNPNRSSNDLRNLLEDLDSHKTGGGSNNIANKIMFKFSYNNLLREYKTCLLYLAIFPSGYKIRRSTLVGRWVAEGLITKEDWESAVYHADRCFDVLINRCLVSYDDFGATGKIKSCYVDGPIHEFISKIARKEHILDARLSNVWAHHFSIFSDIRLRASESIDNFVMGLSKFSPQFPLLKVLDLEGCQCFEENHYLKDICKSIPLLKYLSLRRTNVTRLPREINRLQELEILDIRQTKVPASDTRHVLLLKLRRLLAGHVDPTPSNYDTVQIPSKIKKMIGMEVLFNVMTSRNGGELNDIGNLSQLRKLGVVIEDKAVHLHKLLQAISDLKDCIRSLSITLPTTTNRSDGTPYGLSIKENVRSRLECTSKRSLSISGQTNCVEFLSRY